MRQWSARWERCDGANDVGHFRGRRGRGCAGHRGCHRAGRRAAEPAGHLVQRRRRHRRSTRAVRPARIRPRAGRGQPQSSGRHADRPGDVRGLPFGRNQQLRPHHPLARDERRACRQPQRGNLRIRSPPAPSSPSARTAAPRLPRRPQVAWAATQAGSATTGRARCISAWSFRAATATTRWRNSRPMA